jgi:hypothetical protein
VTRHCKVEAFCAWLPTFGLPDEVETQPFNVQASDLVMHVATPMRARVLPTGENVQGSEDTFVYQCPFCVQHPPMPFLDYGKHLWETHGCAPTPRASLTPVSAVPGNEMRVSVLEEESGSTPDVNEEEAKGTPGSASDAVLKLQEALTPAINGEAATDMLGSTSADCSVAVAPEVSTEAAKDMPGFTSAARLTAQEEVSPEVNDETTAKIMPVSTTSALLAAHAAVAPKVNEEAAAVMPGFTSAACLDVQAAVAPELNEGAAKRLPGSDSAERFGPFDISQQTKKGLKQALAQKRRGEGPVTQAELPKASNSDEAPATPNRKRLPNALNHGESEEKVPCVKRLREKLVEAKLATSKENSDRRVGGKQCGRATWRRSLKGVLNKFKRINISSHVVRNIDNVAKATSKDSAVEMKSNRRLLMTDEGWKA